MFANMGFATKIFVISFLGYQFLSNCGVCGIEDCIEKLDMVIVVDSSFSVRLANFNRVKDFLKSLIGHLPVQSDRIRVSVVRYATQVHVISYLNNQTNKSEKIAAVASMKYRYGATHTHAALRLTRTDVLIPERGDRPDVPNLVIVTTDGASQNESWTTEEAMALKADDNLKIFVIGIGDEVVDSELEGMASRPEMVYKLTNFTQLTQILETLARFSCSDMKEDSISELKSWSNSKSGFIATTTKASSASKTSSPSQHPSTASSTPSHHPSTASSTQSQRPSTASSTQSQRPSTASSTPSQRPSTASSTPSQRPSTASSTPSQRPSTASSTPSQRPSTASSTPSQRPSTASSTPSQRPSTASSTPSQRPSTASSTPSSTTFTSTLTSTTFPSTSHSTHDLRSSVFSTTLNLLTSMTPLPSTEFESSDDTVFLSTTQDQTHDTSEDLYNSNLTTHTLTRTLHSRLTSESESKTESTLEQKTVTEVSDLFDAKTTYKTETLSSTRVFSKDTSHTSSTETPIDSTTQTSEHSTTLVLSTDSETGDFDGLGVIEDSTENLHTRTTNTTYLTTTATSTLVSTDVTQSNTVYVTNFSIPVSATNSTFDTSVSQRSVTTTPSLPTQTTSVDIHTHASTMGNTTSPFHVYTQLTQTSKKPRRKNKTLTSTISTEPVSKTTKSVLSQSSTVDSHTSTSQVTTGVQQPTRKLTSRTSSINTETSVGNSQTQVPPSFSSTESSSTHYQTSEDSRTTYDMNDHQGSVSSTQRSTVVVEYDTYDAYTNTSSINTTTAQDIYDSEDGGDISSRDVYIFVAGGSATAIIVTAMGTFLVVLCRRRDSKRNQNTEL